VGRGILRRCKGDTASYFLKSKSSGCGRVIGPRRSGPLDLHVYRVSWFHRSKLQIIATKIAISRYAISRQSKDSVWATVESKSGGQVARAIGVSQREVAKTLHQDSQNRDPRIPNRGDGTLKGQLTCVSGNRHIRSRESVKRSVRHHE
jgi:hypothetical protein